MNNARQPAPSRSLLADYFAQAGLALSDRQLDLFWEYHRFLRRRDAELNLTRLHAFETMVIKHYLDCALAPGLTDMPSPLMDIGSGAGLPGIPIKIMRPDLQLVLAEGRKNRVAFLREAIDRLGLAGVAVHAGRIYQDTCMDPPVQGIITRALETADDTLARVAGCLGEGGRAIFMKGPEGEGEIKEALRRHPDYRLVQNTAYRLPRLGDARRLLVFERISKPNFRSQPEPITSPANEIVKELLALQISKGIRKQGKYLAGGPKLLAEIVRGQPRDIRAWITTPGMPPPPAAAADCRWIVLSGERFREVNSMGTPGPLAALDLPPIPEFDPRAAWPPGCTLFIPFGDPENVGAAIRAAAGLGAARVVLLRDAACPFLPKAIRASAGAVRQIRLESGPFLKDLEPAGAAPLYALDPGGAPLDRVTPPERYGLVVGAEGQGLPDEIRKGATLLSIPLANRVESLNAAAAAAVALWAWRPPST